MPIPNAHDKEQPSEKETKAGINLGEMIYATGWDTTEVILQETRCPDNSQLHSLREPVYNKESRQRTTLLGTREDRKKDRGGKKHKTHAGHDHR